MTRPKKPIIATMHAVRIYREGESAIINYKNPSIGGVHLKIGPNINEMTDQDILDLHNQILSKRDKFASEYHHVAVEIPVDKPQIKYSDNSTQWVPRGDVLRCLVHDDENRELVVEIDGHELSLKEFGRMLTTYAGWGMRIVFVPDDEITKIPDIVIEDAED